jgi:hypothetical protein
MIKIQTARRKLTHILGSLIQTCQMGGVNTWDYLVTIMRWRKEARRSAQSFNR